MKFNKEVFFEDLEVIFGIFVAFLILGWLISLFGLVIAADLYKHGYHILAYLIPIFDIVLVIVLLFKRYLKKIKYER